METPIRTVMIPLRRRVKRQNHHCQSTARAVVPALSFQAYAHPDSFHEVLNVPGAFGPDYEEMERTFKIFVYPHNITVCDDKYANEGLFYLNLDQTWFWTKDPETAHLFLIPLSCYSSPPGGRSEDERASAVEDFVISLISKYPYWNRTLGADHFLVTCADIHVTAAARIANLLKNSIRVMCSPSYDAEYVPHKDVSLPQYVSTLALPAAGNIIKDR
ncbi:unnamed protein product [Dovyalis caffra]|uniref:Exostosin GT47 domain-containing protein n=1 Tax=Dovyalis caffra TaxID=77055 RepID=A0AAV1SNU9_9ROSI|nr:unnamed protein product [Dovyalis caffra]